MNESNFFVTPAVLARWEPGADAVYPIDDVARFVGRSRRYVALCIRYGLITPAIDSKAEGWFFSAEAVRTLRRIEDLRLVLQDDFVRMRLVLGLMKEIERLREEMWSSWIS